MLFYNGSSLSLTCVVFGHYWLSSFSTTGVVFIGLITSVQNKFLTALVKIGQASYLPFAKTKPKAYVKNNSTCPNDSTASSRKVQKNCKWAGMQQAQQRHWFMDALVTMLFCHLSNAASLRDISNGSMSIAGNSITKVVSRTSQASQMARFMRVKWQSLYNSQQAVWLYLIEDTWITNGFTIWTAEISISLQGLRRTWITKWPPLMWPIRT